MLQPFAAANRRPAHMPITQLAAVAQLPCATSQQVPAGQHPSFQHSSRQTMLTMPHPRATGGARSCGLAAQTRCVKERAVAQSRVHGMRDALCSCVPTLACKLRGCAGTGWSLTRMRPPRTRPLGLQLKGRRHQPRHRSAAWWVSTLGERAARSYSTRPTAC